MTLLRSNSIRSVSKQLAHSSILPLGNHDLRPLQDLITAEKNLIASIQKVSQDFSKAAEALKAWGCGEGEDLDDILTKSCDILQLLSEALDRYAGHGNTIRTLMKDVRTREENFDELKRRRRNVGSKADGVEKKLSKMPAEHKHRQTQTALFAQLTEEMRVLDDDIRLEEARIGDYKRRTTKEWMDIKYGSTLEVGLKFIVVGDHGKALDEEIPLQTTTPGFNRATYRNQESAEQITTDTIHQVNNIIILPPPESNGLDTRSNTPELQQTNLHYGSIKPSDNNPQPTIINLYRDFSQPHAPVPISPHSNRSSSPAAIHQIMLNPDYDNDPPPTNSVLKVINGSASGLDLLYDPGINPRYTAISTRPPSPLPPQVPDKEWNNGNIKLKYNNDTQSFEAVEPVDLVDPVAL
ncbi:hypothetical protein FRC03_000316 [Tulasnella sp. 419]|nr:hypothetical protein FRC02_003882 [Tulasnella sp. 418]KAG8949503.1 hypothetical protein FRC03_000316 [Tulasnella sp. 419]